MLKTIQYAAAAALIAASQLAAADVAGVVLTDIKVAASGGQWWDVIFKDVSWLEPTAGAVAGLDDPATSDSKSGWHGNAMTASVSDYHGAATAGTTAATSGDFDGMTAFANAAATNRESVWAFSKVYDGKVLVGSGTTITVSAKLADIYASGTGTSQANASIELCGADFSNAADALVNCVPMSFAEAFVDQSLPGYTGPSVLSASWTNDSSDGAWTWMRIGLSASVQALPEPTSAMLCLASLGAAAAVRRRRKG
ncbi:PEP-CTERM sorting domain-containing protein [Roseateles sp.]|uniref:PEP-CTERM sorting domain-containing protein n=1 Tax=Roseateles sp. TaxID=1971397 RepID=UPI0032655190